MSEPRDTRAQSPHGVAILAALLVLCSGFGVGTYFVELRGIGLSAMLAGELAPELVILGGAVLAMAVMVQLHVARAARRADPTRALRSTLRQALTCLDASEAGDFEALQGMPAEMHDFVGIVAAEKTRTQEAQREVQSLRREMNELLQGLERSATALEPLREDTKSEFSLRVARAWNNLLERRESSRREPHAGPVSMTLDLGGAALQLPHESPQMPAVETQDLVYRLSALEASLAQLRDEVRAAPLSRQFHAMSANPGMEASVLAVPELPADDILPDLRLSTRSTLHRAAPEPTLEDGANLFAPTDDPLPEGLSLPDSGRAEVSEIAHSRSEVAPPSTTASASGYHEWTGHSGLEGSWRLQEEAETALQSHGADDGETGFEPTPTFTPPAQPVFVDDTYAAPAGVHPALRQVSTPFLAAPPIPPETAAADPGFEIEAEPEFRFPHFVGKPGGKVEGRVAVTFEGTRPPAPRPEADQAADAAANPTAGRSLIVDLRALGAVELEE